MPDAICFGELLIDFVPTVTGVSLIEAPAFQKAPGGAPANVAVGLSKLGVSSGFLGKVGEDAFGHFLAQTLEKEGVDISELRYSQQARTMLAFVSLRADGERDFMFYRHPSADMLYAPEEVPESYIRQAKAFHFGSISLISEPSRSATLRAVEIAVQAGLLVSYDPNLRLNLWESAEAARQGLLLGWPYASLIKVSAEELAFLSGHALGEQPALSELRAAAHAIWHAGLELLVVTLGAQGSAWITRQGAGLAPGFSVKPVDTTGAGDGFVAGLLHGVLSQPSAWHDPQALPGICRFANAVGALTTTQRGAIPALPDRRQVQHFMEQQP